MLNAFIWMLKVKNFKKHFIYLTLTIIISFSIIYFIPAFNLPQMLNLPITITCYILPILAIWGYFWDVTQNVVDREVYYENSSIYNKSKQKEIVKIELPDFNLFKHVWRGISALIASVLILLPLYLLLKVSGTMHLLSLSAPSLSIASIACIYYFAFFPALWWNYAKNNSIVSVFNIPKAVYIMGNYPKRYVQQFLLMTGIALVDTIVNQILVIGPLFILNKEIFSNINIQTLYSLIFNIDSSILFILLPLAVLLIKSIYISLVYAYLLGTIAPIDEF